MQGSRILEWAEELSDRFARAVGESVILRWLCTRAPRIGSAFGRGCFFRLFDGDRFLGRVSARCARKGLAERFCLGVGKRLLLTSASSFAVFFAFYGAVSAVLLSVGEGRSISFGSVLSLSLLLASLPLLHLETPMGALIGQSAAGRALLRFCALTEPRTSAGEQKERGRFSWAAMLFGIGAGFFALLHPLCLPMILLLLFGLALLLRVPELLLLFLAAGLPLFGFFSHPTYLLLGLTLLLEIAFLQKYRRGRRTLTMGYLQLLILLLALLHLLGGVIGYGGGATLACGAARAVLTLAFFPASSLFSSPLWRRRITRALQISAGALSLGGILQYFFTEMELRWLDADRFALLGGRVSLSFGNPNLLAAYLLLVLPLSLGDATDREEKRGWRVLSSILLGLEGLCLLLTWSRGAWLGAIAAVLVYLLLSRTRTRALLLLGALPTALLLPALPRAVLLRFGSIGSLADSSTRYRVYTWRGVLRMLRAHPFGIGTGESAFRAVYPAYAVSGTESVMHAHNLLLGTAVSLGLPGLLVLLLLLLLWGLWVLHGCARLSGRARVTLLAPSAGLLGFLVMGCFDDPWYHFGVFAAFWIQLALSLSAFGEEALEKGETNYAEIET